MMEETQTTRLVSWKKTHNWIDEHTVNNSSASQDDPFDSGDLRDSDYLFLLAEMEHR